MDDFFDFVETKLCFVSTKSKKSPMKAILVHFFVFLPLGSTSILGDTLGDCFGVCENSSSRSSRCRGDSIGGVPLGVESVLFDLRRSCGDSGSATSSISVPVKIAPSSYVPLATSCTGLNIFCRCFSFNLSSLGVDFNCGSATFSCDSSSSSSEEEPAVPTVSAL